MDTYTAHIASITCTACGVQDNRCVNDLCRNCARKADCTPVIAERSSTVFSYFFVQTDQGNFVRADSFFGDTVWANHDDATRFSTRAAAEEFLSHLAAQGDAVVEIEYYIPAEADCGLCY